MATPRADDPLARVLADGSSGRALAALALGAAVACGGPPRAEPIVDPPDGLAIALYRGGERGYAVVDDRRTIEVTGGRVLLDRIERGAALPALVIEPLGAARGKLTIDQCARERLRPDPADAPKAGAGAVDAIPSPMVACTVTGPPGRHRVRVHHVAPSDGFGVRHEIAMAAPDRATVSTRFTLRTPAWGGARAEVVLHEGLPGAGDPPREVGRGAMTLDGGTVVLAPPPREVPARLVHVYDGMARSAAAQTDVAWGKDSRHAVRVLLELDGEPLLPAPAHVRLSIGGQTYDLDTTTAAAAPTAAPAGSGRHVGQYRMRRESHGADALAAEARAEASRTGPARATPAGPTRLPLWIDPLLRGTRKRITERADGVTITERLELTVSNTGGEPREVWIEEPLRPARRRELARPRPDATDAPRTASGPRAPRPEIAGDVARLKLVVAPGQVERLRFTVRYTF